MNGKWLAFIVVTIIADIVGVILAAINIGLGEFLCNLSYASEGSKQLISSHGY